MKTKILSTLFLILCVTFATAQVAVRITAQAPTPPATQQTPCSAITYKVEIDNNSTIDLAPKINITFTKATVLELVTPVTGVAINSVTSSSADFEYAPAALVHNTTNNTFYFRATVGCSSIPDVGNSAFVSFTANVTNATGTVTINTQANPLTIQTSINFPYLSYTASSPLNTVPTIYYSNSPAVETMVYTNTGLAPFQSCVSMAVTNSCNYNVTQVEFFKNTITPTPIATVTTSPFQVCLSGANALVNGDRLIVRVTLLPAATTCVSANCNNIKFELSWGCTTNDLCKLAPIAPDAVLRNIYPHPSNAPYLLLERVSPVPPAGQEMNWDASCSGTQTSWEYIVRNTGNMPANNVVITLDKGILNSNTYIDLSSVSCNYTSTAFNITTPLAGVGSFVNTPFTATEIANDALINSCVSAASQYDCKKITFTIPLLGRGEKMLLKFNTFRCCPAAANVFNTGYTYNRWTVAATAKNCSNFPITVNSSSADYTPTSPPGGANILLYEANIAALSQNTSNLAISTNCFDNGPDLMLNQDYTPAQSDISGGRPGLGAVSTFFITNTTFTSSANAGISGYDQQLFCASPTTGNISQSICGNAPKGKFMVEIVNDPTGGVILNNSNPPFISKGASVWANSGTTTGPNGGAAYIFDIATSGFATAGDVFRNFFIGSQIFFDLQGFCGTPGVKHVKVNTYFFPNPTNACATCYLPLTQKDIALQLHCPGCITPGAIISEYKMERSSYGYQDVRDLGGADYTAANTAGLTPITTSYSRFSSLNLSASIAGDKLRSTTWANFYDGGGLHGWTYGDWQNANPGQAFNWLYFEQEIVGPTGYSDAGVVPDVNGGGTLTIQPAGSSTVSYNFPIAGHVTVSNISGRCMVVTAIDLSLVNAQLGNSLTFSPGDIYTLKLDYVVTKNPGIAARQDVTIQNWAYFTPSAIDLTIHPAPYNPYATPMDLVGDLNIAPYAPLPASTPALYYCEGLSGHHFIYPVVPIYNEEYINGVDALTPQACRIQDDLCTKIVKITVGQKIWNDGNFNVFPFEYRLVPAVTPTDLNVGMRLQSSAPYFVRMTLPQGFTPATEGLRAYSICYAYSDLGNIRTIQNNVPDGTTTTSDVTFAATGVPNTWDMKIDYTKATYQPLLINSAGNPVHTGLTLSPGLAGCAVRQNLIVNNTQSGNVNRNLLLVGDEMIEQHFEFKLNTACAAMTNPNTNNSTDGYRIWQGHVFARMPEWVNAPQSGIADVDEGLVVGTGNYSTPDPVITFDAINENNVAYCSNTVTIPIRINSNVAVNNVVMYLNTNFFNNQVPGQWPNLNGIAGAALPGIVFNNFTPRVAELTQLNYGSVRAFQVNLAKGSNSFTLTLSANSCSDLFHVSNQLFVLLPIQFTWACDGLPTTLNPLPVPSCRNGTGQLAFRLNPINIQASSSVANTRTTCAPFIIDYAINNSRFGGFFNIGCTFTVPAGFTVQEIKYYGPLGTTPLSMNGTNTPTYTATPIAGGLGGTNCVVDFSPVPSLNYNGPCTCTAPCNLNGLDRGDALHMLIYLVPRCGTTVLPQFKIKYSGREFCGGGTITQPAVPPDTEPGTYALPGGANATLPITPGTCTPPVISLTPHDETCIGGSNGWIGATVTGNPIPNATPPYLYNWSNGATTQNPDNLAPGNYTVTVTDRFCTATATANVGSNPQPFSRYIENYNNCAGAANDPFYDPGPPSNTNAKYWQPVLHDMVTDKDNNVIVGGTWWHEVKFTGAGSQFRTAPGIYTGPAGLGIFIAKYNENGGLVFPPIIQDATNYSPIFNYGGFYDLSTDVETDENGIIFAKMDNWTHFNAYDGNTGLLIRSFDFRTAIDPLYSSGQYGGIGQMSYKIIDDNIFFIGSAYSGFPTNQTTLYFFRMSKSQFLNGAANPFIANTAFLPGSSLSDYLTMDVVKSGSDYYTIVCSYQILAMLDQTGNLLNITGTGFNSNTGSVRVSTAIDKINGRIFMTSPEFLQSSLTPTNYSNTLGFSYSIPPPPAPAPAFAPLFVIPNTDIGTFGIAYKNNCLYTASADRIKKFDLTNISNPVSVWGNGIANYQSWPGVLGSGIPCVNGIGLYSRSLSITSDNRLYVTGNKSVYDVTYNGNTDVSHIPGNFILRYCTNSGASFKTDNSETPPTTPEEELAQQLLQDMDIAVYPNPSSGLFNIKCNDDDCDIIYTVYNSLGAKVAQGNFAQKTVVNLKQQPAGIYYFAFKYLNTDNKVVNRKVILDK